MKSLAKLIALALCLGAIAGGAWAQTDVTTTRVSGTVRIDGKDVPLEEVKLRGDRLTFKVAGRRGEFAGQIKGNAIEGTFDGKTPWSATLGS